MSPLSPLTFVTLSPLSPFFRFTFSFVAFLESPCLRCPHLSSVLPCHALVLTRNGDERRGRGGRCAIGSLLAQRAAGMKSCRWIRISTGIRGRLRALRVCVPRRAAPPYS